MTQQNWLLCLWEKKKTKLLKWQDKGYKANSAFNQKVHSSELWVLNKKKGHVETPHRASRTAAEAVAEA